MLCRHCQNIITGNGFSAIRLNSLNYDSRFLFTGIFKEIGVYLAIKKTVIDNIKRVAQGVDCQLLSPAIADVGSQSN